MSSDHTTYQVSSHDDDEHPARASLGEKLFIWIAWALAAAFIAFTVGAYLPGFLATSP